MKATDALTVRRPAIAFARLSLVGLLATMSTRSKSAFANALI